MNVSRVAGQRAPLRYGPRFENPTWVSENMRRQNTGTRRISSSVGAEVIAGMTNTGPLNEEESRQSVELRNSTPDYLSST